MREYACHGVVNGVCCTIVDICQIICLERANNLLDEGFFQSRHLTEQAHLLGVRDPHIGVFVGSCSVWNDERTRVSRVKKKGVGEMSAYYT